jgi:hypothetical protein
MSTEVVTSPSVPEHRSRTWFVAAAALVVGLAVGAAIVAVTQTDSSTSSRASSPPAAAPVTAVNTTCAGDGGSLFAVVSAMPTADAGRVVDELSLQTRALLRGSALSSAATSTMPASPDPATLAAVFSRVGAQDATTVMSGLPPETRAAIGSIPTSPQACG